MSTRKGLDTAFVHYGIRREDLNILETLATKHNLDWDWIQEEVLKKYHQMKTKGDLTDERSLIKLIEKAVEKLEVD